MNGKRKHDWKRGCQGLMELEAKVRRERRRILSQVINPHEGANALSSGE
jgi:hypothetical protein